MSEACHIFCSRFTAKNVTQPAGGLLILLSVLALVILLNYFTVRVLSAVPKYMNFDLILRELKVDYEISDD